MKKYFFLLLAALPVSVMAQQRADTVKLKNGQVIPGYIYKLEGGKIYVARSADTLVYNAAEVGSIMFCHPARNKTQGFSTPAYLSASENRSVPGKNISGSGTSNSYSYNAGTFSSFNEKDSPRFPAEKDDAEKGSVTYKCNMCGGSGSLLIRGANTGSTSSATYTFTMEKDKHFFVYAVKLVPGEYNWTYNDTNNNGTKGNLIIKKGEDRGIILFEKE